MNRCGNRHVQHKIHFDHLIIHRSNKWLPRTCRGTVRQRQNLNVDIKTEQRIIALAHHRRIRCLVPVSVHQQLTVFVAYLQRFKIICILILFVNTHSTAPSFLFHPGLRPGVYCYLQLIALTSLVTKVIPGKMLVLNIT